MPSPAVDALKARAVNMYKSIGRDDILDLIDEAFAAGLAEGRAGEID